ncbi:MAG: ShlB/FhaC/HecB family hemolysin secretion/activation protein, partial [Janthinobacterium lividum]
VQLEPSVQISASVTPPVTTDGASEMTVNVKRSPVTLSVNMDTTTSRLRGLVSATENGATALGEQITISTLQPQGTDRERYYALNYAQPIGADGVLMQVNVYDYAANPRSAALLTQGLESEYESRTTRAAVTVGYPFILDAHRNLTGTAGFYAAQNANTFAFQNALAPDIRVASQTRALSLEYSWQLSSETSLVQASGGIYQGLGMLGAGATNNTANVRFNRIRGQFSRTDVYAGNWGTVISGIAQYSGNVLPQTEQISFGGRLFGMGYAASNSTGDSGWGLAVEGNRSFVFDTAYLKRIQAYVVLDKSQTVLNALPQPHGNLGSVGLGLRLSDMRYYSVDVSVAKPTGERPVNEADRALRYNLLFNYKTQ